MVTGAEPDRITRRGGPLRLCSIMAWAVVMGLTRLGLFPSLVYLPSSSASPSSPSSFQHSSSIEEGSRTCTARAVARRGQGSGEWKRGEDDLPQLVAALVDGRHLGRCRHRRPRRHLPLRRQGNALDSLPSLEHRMRCLFQLLVRLIGGDHYEP